MLELAKTFKLYLKTRNIVRAMKSFMSEASFDTERLIPESLEEDSCEPEESAGPRSSYSENLQCCKFSHHETDRSKTECQNSLPELTQFEATVNSYGEEGKIATKNSSFHSLGEKFDVINDTEISLPVEDRPRNLAPVDKRPSGHLEYWNLLLRCERMSAIRLPHNGKAWRPVSVKLEEAMVKFYAADFESSCPFKVVHLTWFHFFRMPVKTKLIRGECLFTTVLASLLCTRGRLAKCGKRSEVKEVKVGCANYSVVLDFIETIHKCIANFPGFRQQGIRYKTEKALIHVENAYLVTKKEKECVTVKQVRIMLKAKVSASPECSLRVKIADNFSEKPALDEVSFHKCVRSRCLMNQTVTARFLPLDNCWFQLISWESVCTRPPPLRCEATVTLCGSDSIQLCARIFTGSTNLDVTSASDVLLRFYIPSEWLETEGKTAVQTIQHCTNISKGTVSYNTTPETMLWSIPKLSFRPCRNFYLTGKPVASISTKFKLSPNCSNCGSQEIVKVPAEMDFFVKGTVQSSEINITSVKMGLKSFGKFKVNYSSTYRIAIPVAHSVSTNVSSS